MMNAIRKAQEHIGADLSLLLTLPLPLFCRKLFFNFEFPLEREHDR